MKTLWVAGIASSLSLLCAAFLVGVLYGQEKTMNMVYGDYASYCKTHENDKSDKVLWIHIDGRSIVAKPCHLDSIN